MQIRSLAYPSFNLQRIPEQELMLDSEQIQSYANADFSESHSYIIQQLKNHLPNSFHPNRILDLGAGSGDMTARLFETFPNANLDAVDGSLPMININKSYITNRFNKHQIQWHQSQIQEWIPEYKYDLFFSNSLLHHLEDPFELWATMQRSIHADSFLFICDLIRPVSTLDAKNLVNLYTKNESEILKKDFYNSLLASYTIEEVKLMLGVIKMADKLSVDQITDRHWICYSKNLY